MIRRLGYSSESLKKNYLNLLKNLLKTQFIKIHMLFAIFCNPVFDAIKFGFENLKKYCVFFNKSETRLKDFIRRSI